MNKKKKKRKRDEGSWSDKNLKKKKQQKKWEDKIFERTYYAREEIIKKKRQFVNFFLDHSRGWPEGYLFDSYYTKV